jgi:hypothetical protein
MVVEEIVTPLPFQTMFGLDQIEMSRCILSLGRYVSKETPVSSSMLIWGGNCIA